MFSPTNVSSAIELFNHLKKENQAVIVYSKYFTPHDFCIWIRSLNTADLNRIYQWVNLPYAKKFWQMDGSKEQLQEAFEQVLNSAHEHSFIGAYNSHDICQIDIYQAVRNEVADFYKADVNDIGVHLLMSPKINTKVRYLSLHVMHAMLEYLFSYSFIENIVAEPDSNNEKACNLLVRCGFSHIGNFNLSLKTASIYTISRVQFQKHFK